MMVRFSCFSPPVNRSKKVVQNSAGKLLADCQSVIEDRLVRLATGSEESKPIIDRNQNISPSFQMECWQSDDLNAKHTKARDAVSQIVYVKKSHSLGNMMEKESGFSVDDTTGSVDIDHGFSREYLNDWNTKEVRESFGNAISFEVNRHENDGNSYHNKRKENALIKSRDLFTDSIRNESLFSVEISKHYDHDKHDVIVEWTADHIGISRCSSKKLPTLARSSCSLANFKVSAPESNEDALSHSHKFRTSRSFSDLNSFERLGSEFQNWGRNFDSAINVDKNIIVPPSYVKPSSDFGGKAPCHPSAKEETLYNDSDDEIRKLEAKDAELKQSYQPETSHYNWDHLTTEETLYNDSDDEIRKLEAKDAEIKQSYQPETSHYNWDHLTPEEFSMKRVEHWINQIDICDDFIVEEPEVGCTNVSREDPEIIVEPRKADARNNHTMDVPQNRISSLSSSSSSVQMANVGLVAVPVLSPFVGLRVLNLSGNVIVRVTPGSLPKGLHMLNLSKNNISNIEGLRDLSHLRVLDLSYNRIAKIGHGLSSCTSLKELYLSGNKISDVEGLHRLAKLNIIDLRFNKISTANGLGQLAANYISMQTINIEGNPVQINVGDEQLKKFLLSLLPNLVYYNKQTIRKGSKEVSGRGNFAAASPHFDRGTRAEHKLPRRASISSGLYKSAINQGRQSPAEAMPKKETKDRHTNVLLPQPALKLTNRHLDSDSGKKLRSDAMRRTQSTNALQKYFKS